MQRPGPKDETGRIENEWPLTDSTQIRLLYVGADEDELGAVASYAAREYDELTLVTNTDVTAAVETVQHWPFDCVVVESDHPQDDWLTLLQETTCPAILYTDTDPGEIGSTALDCIDTIVGKAGAVRKGRRYHGGESATGTGGSSREHPDTRSR